MGRFVGSAAYATCAAQGMTVPEASAALGVTPTAVRRAARVQGLIFADVLRAKAATRNVPLMVLFIRGATALEAMAATGLSRAYVYQWAARFHLKFMTERDRLHAALFDCLAAGMTKGEAAAKLGASARDLSGFAKVYAVSFAPSFVAAPTAFAAKSPPATDSAPSPDKGTAARVIPVCPAAQPSIAALTRRRAPAVRAVHPAPIPAPHDAAGIEPAPLTVQRFAREINVAGCRALWAEVLLLHWRDAISQAPNHNNSRLRNAARNWFGTTDFYQVCALCGVDGAAVMDRFNQKVGACAI